jgi:hypothetical protein
MKSLFYFIKRPKCTFLPTPGNALVLFYLTLSLNGCSTSKVLMGEIRPIESHSNQNDLPDLNKSHPQWKTIEKSADSIDAAWQSEKTSAIISINSSCRESGSQDRELKTIIQDLLAPWRDLKTHSEKSLTVSGHPALEVTGEGYYLKNLRKFQTIAIQSDRCIYDLIYLSSVKSYQSELSVFLQFRDNLILK